MTDVDRDEEEIAAQVVLSPISPADAGEVLTIQRAAFVSEALIYGSVDMPPLVQTWDELAAELRHADGWVARLDGRLVGAIRTREADGLLLIGRIAIAPDMQGFGIGQALLEAAESHSDASQAELFTGSLSEANIRLYEHCGYVETERVDKGDGVQEVFLRKRLRDSARAVDDGMDQAARVPASTSLAAWLERLAQADGAPGGGAACGVMLGLAAALLRMVAEYTPNDARASECAARLVTRRTEALAAAEDDGVRSAEFGAALALPADDPRRDERVREAAIGAAQSSVRLGDVGTDLVDELRLLAEIGNPHLAADLTVAGEALAAGIAGASINLRANLQLARAHGGGDELGTLRTDSDRLRAARDAAVEVAAEESRRFDSP